MSDFDLDSFIPYRLAVLAGKVSREFSNHYSERFGISRAEWRVVAHLSASGPASVGEIHQRVDMDKSRVSRAATRLEKDGLLTKEEHPVDGRLVKLSLTALGEAMMLELEGVANAYQTELLARLGSDGEETFAAVERLGKAADA
ncbi:MarR family winged helix-turn-helix transcriptional regulator [Tropicimonas sp. TH_r6]|uniref:MarR family winged helix-turn-helix transcriptional regulator n=1 Tax=Tropicimonas sp. TH_r6 TaxID=3082085 RepID=UPI0029548D9E|nr:MarR family winged helix-turn-helix transcriptional regulator [Tropicimonas sp. TH_r6]MDV7144701.1 MarR family winged helix-turn-helix transcriptional regulator [Tropicimonas sp. TH_r6]